MRVRAFQVKGFTLVELIIGIVVFSISLSIITQWVAPLTRQSIDPLWQVRATELGQSLLNEISAKSFDENSDRATGLIRCNEDLDGSGTVPDATGEVSCTPSGGFGHDDESRENFDDVDDYDGFSESDGDISNSLDTELTVDGQNLYQGFTAAVTVIYDSDYDGVADLNDGTQLRKRILVTITTPGGQALEFTRYRSNF